MALVTGRTLVCPVDNLPGHACDPGTHGHGEPVDDPVHATQGAVMAQEPEDLQEYEYEWAGGTYTAQLSERHAKRLKARAVGSVPKATSEPEEGGGTTIRVGDTGSAESAQTKARTTAKNKSAEQQ